MPGAESLVRVYILPGLHRAQHAAPYGSKPACQGEPELHDSRLAE